jgi:hypothetical protein
MKPRTYLVAAALTLALLAGAGRAEADPDKVADYARLLADNDAGVREQAALALKRLGPKASAALPALRKALLDPDADVRSAVAAALKAIAPRQDPKTDREKLRDALKRLAEQKRKDRTPKKEEREMPPARPSYQGDCHNISAGQSGKLLVEVRSIEPATGTVLAYVKFSDGLAGDGLIKGRMKGGTLELSGRIATKLGGVPLQLWDCQISGKTQGQSLRGTYVVKPHIIPSMKKLFDDVSALDGGLGIMKDVQALSQQKGEFTLRQR